MAAPFVQRRASSGCTSTWAVGLDSGKTMGRAALACSALMMAWPNSPGTPDKPSSAVAPEYLTVSSRLGQSPALS